MAEYNKFVRILITLRNKILNIEEKIKPDIKKLKKNALYN